MRILLILLSFFSLSSNYAFPQDEIQFIKCEKSECLIQNPFGKNQFPRVTAKVKGRCSGEYVNGNYTVTYSIDDDVICEYEGDILNGTLTGTCKITYIQKAWTRYSIVDWKTRVYAGGILNGKYHGQGVLNTLFLDKTSLMMSGNWENDQLNGEGELFHSNGLVYTGNFKNNEYDGQGRLSYYGEIEEGIFKGGAYLGKTLPPWITETNSIKERHSTDYPFSRIDLIVQNGNLQEISFDPYIDRILYAPTAFGWEGKTDKILDLHQLTVRDTLLKNKSFYDGVKKYKLEKRPYECKYDVIDTRNDSVIVTLQPSIGSSDNCEALFHSGDKLVTLGGKSLQIYYLSEGMPIIKEISFEKSQAYAKVFVTSDDKFIGKTEEDGTLTLYDAESLEKVSSCNLGEQPYYVWDDGSSLILRKNYLLKCYRIQEGKITFENEFPAPEYRSFKIGDEEHGIEDFFVFPDYIAIKYRGATIEPIRIFDRKSQKCLFSFENNMDWGFKPNHDCSAFIVTLPGSRNPENYEGYRKFVIYNTGDTVNGLRTMIDLDPEETNKQIAEQIERIQRQKDIAKFDSAVILTDKWLFVNNSNDGKSFVDWMNASNADDIKTWDRINIFLGGMVKNTGKEPYIVYVGGNFNYRIVRTVAWIFREATQEKGNKMYTYFKLMPGESKPFLFVTRNLSNGWYASSSGIGARLVFDDPPYDLNVSFTTKMDPEQLAQYEKDERDLIEEFMNNNGNLASRYPGFHEKYISATQSELNVYFSFSDEEQTVTLYDSDDSEIESNTATKQTSFLVDADKTYYVVLKGRKFEISTRDGINQLFINADGSSKVEYMTK